jgi:hypothetical protein
MALDIAAFMPYSNYIDNATSSEPLMSHFSAKTLRALSRKGVRIVGLQYLPDMSSAMPMANGETGNDKVRDMLAVFAEEIELAAIEEWDKRAPTGEKP